MENVRVRALRLGKNFAQKHLELVSQPVCNHLLGGNFPDGFRKHVQVSPEDEMDKLAQGVGSTLTGLWGGAKGIWSSSMTYSQQVGLAHRRLSQKLGRPASACLGRAH